ncbi:GNAT family N-acetyltransferase [bacterium SCSIO 12741]|nr:GNAT family N-acetyltransferase [bacterium SCSIO 12741]
MNEVYQFEQIDPNDRKTQQTIARWYEQEWTTPQDKTLSRLASLSPEGQEFHFLVRHEGEPIAAGGLSNEVHLLKVHPEYQKYGPWVALLYTLPSYRNRGIGKQLLEQVETEAGRRGLSRIYLYTFTAESLYLRAGWRAIERFIYRGNDAVIMEKEITKS